MSAETLVGLARSAAASHRLGCLGQGGETLARFVDELTGFLRVHPERGAALGTAVGAIVAAQQRGDPIGLADVLEHELLPRLLWP